MVEPTNGKQISKFTFRGEAKWRGGKPKKIWAKEPRKKISSERVSVGLRRGNEKKSNGETKKKTKNKAGVEVWGKGQPGRDKTEKRFSRGTGVRAKETTNYYIIRR